MKTLLATLLCVLALAAGLQAQSANSGLTYAGATTLISGGTNKIGVLATNTYTARMDLPRADSVCIFISARPVLSNNVNLTLKFSRSPDGTTYDTLNPLQVACIGTTNADSGAVVSLTTNVPIGAVPYFRLDSVASPETIAICSNLTVSYGFKR